MESRKSTDERAAGLMLLICMIWGLQQVVLKAAAPDVAPILQIALRSGMAAVLVWLLMRYKGERLSLHNGTWKPGLLVGFLFALEYLLVGEGLRYTTASHSVVFLYTAPLFAGLGLHWKLPSERLQPLQWCGILATFTGICITFFWRGDQVSETTTTHIIIGDLLALLGGISWGATTVVIRCTRLSVASAGLTLLYQLAGAFLLLLPAAAILDQTGFNPTPLAWGSLLFQTLIVSFASFLAWFWLLRNYMASQLGAFSFMTPLFGVAFGVWLLQEPLEPSFLIGAVLVLSGILMVSGYGWLRQITHSILQPRG